jgi:hypothetical protein
VRVDDKITVQCADLSAWENAAQAVASSMVSSAFTELRDRGMIDDKEYLRLVYRFLGEVVSWPMAARPGDDLNLHNKKD